MAKWTCCVPFCKNYKGGKAPAGITWHAFPRNEAHRNTWISRIEQEVGGHFHMTKHSRVCSFHFKAADYRPHLNTKLKLLKRDAVPCIFHWNTTEEVASTDDSSQSSKPSDVVPSAYNHSYNHHAAGGNYDASAVNGHGTSWDERTSPESDTYELTELTPMVKQERPSPLANSYDDNSAYHVITDLDDPFHTPIKESLALAPPMGLVGTLPNHSVYSDAFKKCIISESFLYTLLKLIKCPQCGFAANSEQMQKYENQGCILGVRLLCYNGHVVLDWRL